jgi:predicted MFS family arabinose efflux permease
MGTALGAAIGGAASASLGFAPLSWVSLPFALAALGTLWISTGNTPHLKTA